ncbi:MAG: hypothetical protein JJ896_07740 [Rhodothermales bacterium]|nr:hypothetical protein [Rhodothermales bacterium]MBO6779531.1 hypothetical protein [Rhodothermales bacterium]
MRLLLLPILALSLVASASAQDVADADADRQARPCHYDERFRAFDFWIGEWEVTVPGGAVAGVNRIDLVETECVLQENWTSANGGTGRSFNYLDAATGRWHQLWVDGRGGHTRYEGEFRDGAMRFEGTNVYGNGTTTMMRMSFTPMDDGRVRQFIEESRDEGQTWSVWFDGYYARSASN